MTPVLDALITDGWSIRKKLGTIFILAKGKERKIYNSTEDKVVYEYECLYAAGELL